MDNTLFDDTALVTSCVCDDGLNASHHQEDPQQQMSDADVLTTAIIAARFCGGNIETARAVLHSPRSCPRMLSKSRLNRRLHRLSGWVETLLQVLGEAWKQLNTESVSRIDSFPIPVCDTIRISRAKLYRGEPYRGDVASKRRSFYGLTLHVLVTPTGRPIECFLTPGAFGDVDAFEHVSCDLPEGSRIYADKAYNDDVLEDVLHEASQIQLLPFRQNNSTRPLPPYVVFVQQTTRKLIETAGSVLEHVFPKTIHAVTARGFELKILLFVLAYSINNAL
jgi:hypothetical protein